MIFQVGVFAHLHLRLQRLPVAPEMYTRSLGDVSTFPITAKPIPSPFMQHPPPDGNRKKNLFYFIIDWIFFFSQFFGKTKKNIYFVVNRAFVSLVSFCCCPLSLNNCWPVLYDAFSSLRCLMTRKKEKVEKSYCSSIFRASSYLFCDVFTAGHDAVVRL